MHFPISLPPPPQAKGGKKLKQAEQEVTEAEATLKTKTETYEKVGRGGGLS